MSRSDTLDTLVSKAFQINNPVLEQVLGERMMKLSARAGTLPRPGWTAAEPLPPASKQAIIEERERKTAMRKALFYEYVHERLTDKPQALADLSEIIPEIYREELVLVLRAAVSNGWCDKHPEKIQAMYESGPNWSVGYLKKEIEE